MQYRKVVGLAEGVHGELPVAGHVVPVAAEPLQFAEFPISEVGCQFGTQQLVGIDDAAGHRMHPQQAVLLDRGQRNQAEL